MRRPDLKPSIECLDAVGHAAQTGATLAIRASNPVVENLDHDIAVDPLYVHAGSQRVRVLGDVHETLGNEIEGRHLERLGKPAADRDPQTHRHGRSRGQLLQRNLEPVPTDNGRMNAARDGA